DSAAAALKTVLGSARDLALAHAGEVRSRLADSTVVLPKVKGASTSDSTTAQELVNRGIAAMKSAVDSSRVKADSAKAAGAAAPDSAKAAADSAKAALPEWLRTPGDKLPQENLLFGDEIAIDIVKDELSRVDVVGHGRSKFFPSDKEGDLTEWNDVAG